MSKITETHLRKIIRQEILREAEDSASAAKGEKQTQRVSSILKR